MARTNPLGSITDTALGAVKHPVGTAGKAAGQVKASVGLGRLVTGQTARALLTALLETASAVVEVARQSMNGQGGDTDERSGAGGAADTLRAVPPVNEPAHTTPSDMAPVETVTSGAAVAERTATDRVTADAGDALTPGDLAKQAAAKKAPAKKAPAKKAPAKKAAAKKAPAKKAPAKKAPAQEGGHQVPGEEDHTVAGDRAGRAPGAASLGGRPGEPRGPRCGRARNPGRRRPEERPGRAPRRAPRRPPRRLRRRRARPARRSEPAGSRPGRRRFGRRWQNPYAGAVMTDQNPRSYEVVTYGCQMNVHDSERLTGLLEEAGYVAADRGEQPDVVVFNTCAVRENADNRLYGNLGHLAPVKAARPGMQIAVGGCLAQKDRGEITRRAPWVDVVFGTHNLGSLPALLERSRVRQEAQVEILESLEVFPSTLPTRRESAYAAWVSISVGCNNTCTFCIVPSLRGKEKDRRPGEVLAEIEALVAEGVSEVTLLGQNVNSYGVEFGDRLAFGKLLRACGDVPGLERVRFTSPHPKDFTDDVIAAMAETPNVMPQLHMPLQSGSDRVLKAMRRSYRQERYLGIIDRVRAAMPEASITTDIIVGFPGETEADFLETMKVVERARFSGAFTFQYSKRPGTPAAVLDEQVPRPVVQDRYERLVALVDEVAWSENRALVGSTVELMVAEGEGRKDRQTHRLSGRARDNRLVHFTPVDDAGRPVDVRPGDVVEVTVSYGAPHHLVADGAVTAVRRTRAGDAWQAGTVAPTPRGVDLGLPAVGVPAPLPVQPGGCPTG